MKPFSVLDITESCEDHLFAINGFIIENPTYNYKKAKALRNAASTLQKFIDHFDEGNFHENKQYVKKEIVNWITDISKEMDFLISQLKTFKKVIVCDGDYDKAFRKAIHAGGDQILSKCYRKLVHIQTGIANSPDIISNTSHIEEPLKLAIKYMADFRLSLVISNHVLPKLLRREALTDWALKDLDDAMKNIEIVKKFIEADGNVLK